MESVTHSARSKRSEQPSAFYTMADVAGICNLGYSTLWEMVQQGTFPVRPVKLGRQWRFPKTQIDQLAGLNDGVA